MLRIALSSRSLFHMEEANSLFESEGQGAYDALMREKEREPLEPGMAFNLVSKLLALNTPGAREPDRVEVMLLSRNSPSAGVRIMNSVHAHGLKIDRAVFTSGHNRYRYAQEFGADLFLSAKTQDTEVALSNGIAAATMATGQAPMSNSPHDRVVRIAFDGDSVIFSDEADQIYREKGLESFTANERQNEHVPLGEGPFKRLLSKLCELQVSLPLNQMGECPLRIGLVTARSVSASGRVIHTLRSWGLSVDEVVFAGGAPKGPLLRAFGADFFIDDTRKHIESAHSHQIPAAQVPGMPGGIGAEPQDSLRAAGAAVLPIRQVQRMAHAQTALIVSQPDEAQIASAQRRATRAAP